MFTPQPPIGKTVGTTATMLCGAVKGRKNVTVQNTGAVTAYVGYDSTVTAVNGFKLPADGTMNFTQNDKDPTEGYFFALVSSGTTTLVVSQS